MKKTEKKVNEIKIPCAKFCGKSCGDGCIKWFPQDRDYKGRAHCAEYKTYFFPSERQGCNCFKD